MEQIGQLVVLGHHPADQADQFVVQVDHQAAQIVGQADRV